MGRGWGVLIRSVKGRQGGFGGGGGGRLEVVAKVGGPWRRRGGGWPGQQDNTRVPE